MIAPIMLLTVIISLKIKVEINSTINSVILLKRKALFRGMNAKIFCHRIAYTPIHPNTPQKHKIYGIERKLYREALLLNTLVPE